MMPTTRWTLTFQSADMETAMIGEREREREREKKKKREGGGAKRGKEKVEKERKSEGEDTYTLRVEPKRESRE